MGSGMGAGPTPGPGPPAGPTPGPGADSRAWAGVERRLQVEVHTHVVIEHPEDRDRVDLREAEHLPPSEDVRVLEGHPQVVVSASDEVPCGKRIAGCINHGLVDAQVSATRT